MFSPMGKRTSPVFCCSAPGFAELPPIEGAAEVWARGVFHCPYCHGWEVRDRPLAAYGADAAGLALLLTSLSDDVVLLTNGDSNLEPDEQNRLEGPAS